MICSWDRRCSWLGQGKLCGSELLEKRCSSAALHVHVGRVCGASLRTPTKQRRHAGGAPASSSQNRGIPDCLVPQVARLSQLTELWARVDQRAPGSMRSRTDSSAFTLSPPSRVESDCKVNARPTEQRNTTGRVGRVRQERRRPNMMD